MSFGTRGHGGRGFPPFRRPEVAGYFSLSGQCREYSQDLAQLRYYGRRPDGRVRFDLNEGLDRVVRKPEGLNEKIDHLLRWIVGNRGRLEAGPGEKRWLKTDFVCFRGLLTRICCTPFEAQDGWIICAAKAFGTIYLCAVDTEEQKYRNAHLTERDLKFMSYGFKFEQYVLTETPKCNPDPTKPVNEAEEFCCLFSSKLGENYLLYGAEMDGVCSEEVLKEPVNWEGLTFVELKTSAAVNNKWQEDRYRKKLLKWWCQSFLVGIEDVLCGTRSQKGIVYEVNNIKISSMPKMCKDFWNASECMNFCNAFLNHLRTVVTKDYDECIYKFEYKLDDVITMEVLPSTSEFSFIPDWYIKEIHQRMKTRK